MAGKSSTLTPSAPLLQGVAAPDVAVDPTRFYPATRRMRFQQKSLTNIAGLGSTDSVQLRQTGIVSGLEVRVTGTLVFGGTIAGTSMSYDWPFNLINNLTVSANGQSNLINCRGLTIRVLEFALNPKLDDSGLGATFGSTAVTSGSLKLPSDDWGTSAGNSLNPGATVAATGTYTVDITYWVPIAADPTSLIGSIYAQSQATNLALNVTWNTQAALLTLGGAATVTQNLQYEVVTVAYSIPNVGGQYVVPDLSQFHQVAEFRQSGLGAGTNEILLPGTGVGRMLLRLLWNTYSGSTPAPVTMTAANYNLTGWRYGGSDTPEQYANGTMQRAQGIRVCGADIGGNWGVGLHDFASQFALRDAVNEAATSDLRLLVGLVNSPTSGFSQVTQETLFAAPVGA